MRKQIALWLCLLTALAVAAPTPVRAQTSNVAGMGGVIRITPIFHATVQLEYNGHVIIVDPVSAGTYSRKADMILITHDHPDHLDRTAIARLLKPRTFVVAPPTVVAQLKSSGIVSQPSRLISLRNGATFRNITDAGQGQLQTVLVQAVPMYNLVRGPNAGQKFHPEGRGNGYVLTLGGKRIYIAGDTEATPEMKALRKIDVAFLPMNLPYTMTPQEAVQGARAFGPRIVFPYHYRYPFNKANDSPQQFRDALRGTRIQVRLLNWYPASAVARATAAR